MVGAKGVRMPTINQLDHETIVKNIRTGTLYVLAETEAGVKTVVPVGGGGTGTPGQSAFATTADTDQDDTHRCSPCLDRRYGKAHAKAPRLIGCP